MKDEQEKPRRSPRSEFDFINSLRHRAGSLTTQSLFMGIGDDAAVVRNSAGKDTVITVDLLVEDIDFRRTTTPPYLLGHKALAVSLSDIAAMGARPLWSLVSIGMPDDVWQTDFVDRLYDGLLDLAHRYGVQLIGGDTSRTTDKIVIDSIVTGECASGSSVMRSGAKAGDQIFVTGSLGAAAAGLRLIERGAHLAEQNLGDEDSQKLDHILLRQLRPEPRVGWGMVLGEERLATSMIDLSDGLSSDLNHLCDASRVGALIDSSLLPIDDRVQELCGRRALDPLQLALHGGEDFELLFTVKPENTARLPRKVDGVEIKRIGEIKSASEGVKISEGSRTWELKPGGWMHFSA
ncbi:MAG TPA: thiamine-phosphate kinase [Pyrinomonadaceae bacterium]|nr:thiamine-phosphate kinase [Pyrinomonadaceae bacterium]